MDFNTDFKLAGPLAGLFGGIKEGQQEQARDLQNQYQSLKNQEQQYTSAEAQSKLQDPRYLQMKLQNDMAKFGKETSINEIESAYNKANIAVAHLKAAQAQGPEALQQASMQYLQEMKIDPNSQKGQFLLQDPVGNAEKMAQFYATAATNNSEYMQKYSLGEQSAQKALDVARLQGENALKVAQVHESGANARTANQNKYEFNTNKILMDAANGDVKAQQVVNLMSQMKGAAQSGGLAIDPTTNTLTTKGAMMQVPYPDAGLPQQQGGKPAGGGGSYNYVPGQGLQPSGNTSTQRTPPVSGRNAVSDNAPYISKSGGVVANGRTYTYDEYMKSPLSKQYDYADLQVK